MFEKIIEKIEKYDVITIHGHIFPDGDCYGSQIAMREIIKLNYPNKEVYAIGSGYRRFHEFIGEMDDVSLEVIEKSLAIIVDVNDLYRCEDNRIFKAKDWAKVDHHIDTFRYKEGPQVIRTSANSCCEIICDLVNENHFKINATIANALYLGIMTDSGRFQYITDFVKAFSDLEWLCQNGADPKTLNRLLNITYEPILEFKGFVYTHYVTTKDGVIYLILNKEQLKRFNLTADKAGSLVNLISNVHGYPIWVFFCETEDGKDHLEIRSNGPVIQQVAFHFGGGGHLLASGATLDRFDEESIQEVVDMLNVTAKEYLKKEK